MRRIRAPEALLAAVLALASAECQAAPEGPADNTASGWKVDPLPFHRMTRYPYGSDEAYPHPEVVNAWHTRELGPSPETPLL